MSHNVTTNVWNQQRATIFETQSPHSIETNFVCSSEFSLEWFFYGWL